MSSRGNIRTTNGDQSSSNGTGDAARSPATGSNVDSRSCAISRMDKGLEGKRNRIPDERIQALSKALTVGFKDKPHAPQLKPEKVDFHKDQNREAHKTDDYDAANLIIRRGQEFDVTVTFNREYNPGTDEIVLQFVTGSRPQESKGSIVRVLLRDALKPTEWGMKIKKNSGKTMCLTVMPSAKAIIGRYEVFVETKMKGTAPGKESVFRYKDEDKVYILFNAWCKDDVVYMESEEDRNEYVLAEFGYIWVGSAKSNDGIPWIFGQFEDVALDCALWLLNKDGMSPICRSSPVHVTRTMSAMANYNDYDGGILVGRWTSTYPENCTPPTAWTGSVAILEEFWKNKDMMCGVEYGQCWVFSGLVTTLLRALGLPTRSVTNFESAHDTDGSMTIDFHFDEEENLLDGMNDSVWNFHVWNESWFKRPDLPAGHDGWQAHDATPQETSEGVFCCGPASVNAIKNGEVYLPYDTRFIFAEVNGDRVYWEPDDSGSMKPFRVDVHSVGKSISTKKPGAYLRLDTILWSDVIQEDAYASYDVRYDVTSNYKYPDGSQEERDTVKFAINSDSTMKEYEIYPADEEDVDFTLEVLDSVAMGDRFEVKVVVQNKSNNKRTVKVNITSVMAFYTGISAKPLKATKETLSFKAKEEKSVVLKIAETDYMGKLAGDGNIKLYVKGTVEETGQRYAKQDVVEMKKPKPVVTATPEAAKKGEMVKVTASFKNLAVILKNGQFHFEATGMLPKSVVVYCPGNVTSGEEARATATFTTTRTKERTIVVSFVSDQLAGVRGKCTVKAN